MQRTSGPDSLLSPAEMGSGPEGLTSAEAAARLIAFGRNDLPAPRRPSGWRRAGDQLRDPLVLVLIAAAVLTMVTADWPDTAVIALVITGNTIVGVVQELRADTAIAALAKLVTPAVRVVRDGEETTIRAVDLVPGDRVLLAEGDVVPADAELIQASALLIDEAALTGESVPASKSAAGEEVEERSLRAGTIVVRGRAVARVTRTGESSTLGRIAGLIEAVPPVTPLQHKLAELGRVLAVGVFAVCLIYLAIGLSLGQPVELMVVTAISLAVAAVPESLPAVVALSLALGARRMARHSAVVRRLPAVETLGSIEVLVTDKTGTLTEGRMVVEKVWTPTGGAEFGGLGYAPTGQMTLTGGARDPAAVRELMTIAALCNDARLRYEPGSVESKGTWRSLGDPTEGAILAAAGKAGIEIDHLGVQMPRRAEVPFDSLRRRMTTINESPSGQWLVCTKGALESVRTLELTNPWPELTEAQRRAEAFSADGLRVLAVAGAHPATRPSEEDAETGLTLLGLIAMADPPKPAAAETVRACLAAGIHVVIATGDHPATAAAIARRVGILRSSADDAVDPLEVVSGDDIRAGLVDDLTRCRVLARTSPAQKLDLIRAWQSKGVVVAMTGDGVNDGPALRRADIGVAMGQRGTEVARQAADLVLANDELGTLVAAVQEGRRVYANIRRFLTYALAGGVAELLVMLLGPAVGITVPLVAAQILWINLVTHGITGVALGAEPVDPGVMTQPPRPPEQRVLGAGLWQRVLRLSTVLAVAALGVGLAAKASDGEWQSAIFLALTTGQLGVALGMRAQPRSLQNWPLLAAVAGSLALVVGGVYLSPLQSLLTTRAVGAGLLLAALAVGILGFGATALDRRLSQRSSTA